MTAAHRRTVFVSYQTNDSLWAEWVAWQLEVAGLSVFLDKWDNERGGASTTAFMDRALMNTEAMVAIWSTSSATVRPRSMLPGLPTVLGSP